MHSLQDLAFEKKGTLVKLYFARDKSYVGQVAGMGEGYVEISSLCSTKKKERVLFDRPRFRGKQVRGYEVFVPRDEARGPRYIPLEESHIREPLTDRDFGGMGGPFRNSLDAELFDDEEQRRRDSEKHQRQEEIDLFDKGFLHRDF